MITKFARIYTPLVVLAAVLTVAVPVLLMGAPFSVWIYRALIFLVISCPCALVISVPLGYFAGIGRASKGGILLKGSRVLEAFKRVRTVVFDKTGTLTGGRFRIRRLCPAADISEEQLLRAAAVAESFSGHPLAICIREAAGDKSDSPENYFGVKAAVGIAAVAGYGSMWAAVFADVGVALLTVLNSMRILAFEKKSLDRKRFSVHTGEKSK